jgi:hypothetical protein
VVCRGIGVATIIFGLSSIPFDKFTSVWHWVIFILVCALGIGLIFLAAAKLNKYLQSKKPTADSTTTKESDPSTDSSHEEQAEDSNT